MIVKYILEFGISYNKIILFLYENFLPLKIRASVLASLFFLGISPVVFYYDTLPHGFIFLYASLYFFSASEFLAYPFKARPSGLAAFSLSVIIAMPFSNMDKLL